MAGLRPVCPNIQLGGHTFVVNPSSGTFPTTAQRELRRALDGTGIALDTVDGSGFVVIKRRWQFSCVDDGDLVQLRLLQKQPGSLAFVDIYGDSYTVHLTSVVNQSVEGRRANYANYDFELEEV